MKKIFLTLFALATIPTLAMGEGQSESIGTYNNGCILYPAELEKSDIYKLPRLARGNNYGNPALTDFLEDYAYRIKEMTGKQLLIADLSKNNGGPTLMLHSSHQTGLDADIWYRLYSQKQNLSQTDIEDLKPIDMVSKDGSTMGELWSSENEEILKTFAQNDKIERIFVNPIIKKNFCTKFKSEDWQKKIRPWWGHNEHFHVRLKCPDNSPDCTMKGQAIKDDGCGKDLDWWFSEEAKLPKSKKEAEGKISEEELFEKLPERCKPILQNDLKEE